MAVPWRRSARLDGDAVDYFSRVAAVGGLQNGVYSERGTKRRLSDFFVSLKDLGVWPSIAEMGVFLGVADLSSCLVKARYAAGTPSVLTNYNFVAGDYTPSGGASGIKGDGSTKYLSTGTDQTVLLQNNSSMWAYVTNAVSNSAAAEALVGGGSSPSSTVLKTTLLSGAERIGGRLNTATTISGAGFRSGFAGLVRSSSSSIDWRNGTSLGNVASTSAVAASSPITIFTRGGSDFSQSTVCLYGFGSALDMTNLKAACDAVFANFGGSPI